MLATRLRTLAALGPGNLLRVLSYRLGLRLGIHKAQRISATICAGDAFGPARLEPIAGVAPPRAWTGEGLLFGRYPLALGAAPPAWTSDPLAAAEGAEAHPAPLVDWWRIGDFAGGDIKRIWELSRFDWVVAFAQQARAGQPAALVRLNTWLADWALANPPYLGPNWKCAQEASIRLLHLALAARLLGQVSAPSPALVSLILAHVQRILPTLSYARAQDNNHATSEAAALFVAGAWLAEAGHADGVALRRQGRDLIERHTAHLFAADGSFSQYSLNYHRLALDTLSLAELWRRDLGLEPFSTRFHQRAGAATQWLYAMVDPASGDAPNLGANDGASLLALTDCAYRDYRPAVQLAAALFCAARAYPSGAWDAALGWLDVAIPEAGLPPPASATFDEGGYAVLRTGPAMALLRYPRFRFRPSQADVLHCDLWCGGRNLLRDGGSYSYNVAPEWLDYFGGAAAHNTIAFDGQPQMPRLSRFLLGDWLRCDERGWHEGAFRAAYRHRAGWRHQREVRLGDHLRVEDRVEGFAHEARLRWRLAPGDWRIEGNRVTNGAEALRITADVPLVSIALIMGWESRHYLEKTQLPVVEVVIAQPGQIISEYHWTL